MIAEDLNNMSNDGPDDDFIIKSGSSDFGRFGGYTAYINSDKMQQDLQSARPNVDQRLEAAGIDVQPQSSQNYYSDLDPLPAQDYYSQSDPLPAQDYYSQSDPLPAQDYYSQSAPLPAEDYYSQSNSLPAEDYYSQSDSLPAEDYSLQSDPLPAQDYYSQSDSLPAEDYSQTGYSDPYEYSEPSTNDQQQTADQGADYEDYSEPYDYSKNSSEPEPSPETSMEATPEPAPKAASEAKPDHSGEEQEIDASEEELFAQIDEFRQKASRITALIREKQHRMDQLEDQLHEKEVENLRYQQKLLAMKNDVSRSASAAGAASLTKEQVAEAAVRAANEAAVRAANEVVAKSDERFAEHLNNIESKLSDMEKSLSGSTGSDGKDLKELKNDIFEKIHDENVRVYRNIQDFMRENSNNDEQITGIEETMKETKSELGVVLFLAIANLAVMAIVLLTVLGVI